MCSAQLTPCNGAVDWSNSSSFSTHHNFVVGCKWTAVCTLLPEPMSMFPDHGEVYASTLGDCASRFTPDHHSVSTTQSRLNLTVHATGQRALSAGRMEKQWLQASIVLCTRPKPVNVLPCWMVFVDVIRLHSSARKKSTHKTLYRCY